MDQHSTSAWMSACDWVDAEHHAYQKVKTPREVDDRRTREQPEEWDRIIDMYLHRARVLGLDNPLGRQAIGKAAATAMGYLESLFRVHGVLPAPGFPSGEERGMFLDHEPSEETSPS